MGKWFRVARRIAKWVFFFYLGLIILGIGGYQVPWFPPTDVSRQQPYANFVGREYRVVSEVRAYAWNDYPDKAKILSVTITRPPGTRNRFVSYVTPLKLGQTVRIVRAWRQVTPFGLHRYYDVEVPGAGLPEGVDIHINNVASDGDIDPLAYELTGR